MILKKSQPVCGLQGHELPTLILVMGWPPWTGAWEAIDAFMWMKQDRETDRRETYREKESERQFSISYIWSPCKWTKCLRNLAAKVHSAWQTVGTCFSHSYHHIVMDHNLCPQLPFLLTYIINYCNCFCLCENCTALLQLKGSLSADTDGGAAAAAAADMLLTLRNWCRQGVGSGPRVSQCL